MEKNIEEIKNTIIVQAKKEFNSFSKTEENQILKAKKAATEDISHLLSKHSKDAKEAINEAMKDDAEKLDHTLKRAGTTLVVSTILGYCAACFMKKIFKYVTFTVGGLVLFLQVLAYNKLITIHWKEFVPKNVTFSKIVRIVTYSSLGFGLGFYVGIRKELWKVMEEI